MQKTRICFYLFLNCCFSASRAQGIEKTFSGWWATTEWKFEFHENGKYTRTSFGHYGNTEVKGRYTMNGDTIHLLSGYHQTHGTVNPLYILDKDSFLIDIYLRYDYAPVRGDSTLYIYNSRTRKIKYPQTETDNENTKAELESVLNLAFNSDTMKHFCNFQKHPERKLTIGNYGHLQAVITVDSHPAIFKPLDAITDPFYIEIDDINQNPEAININIQVHGENVSIWFYYVKVNGLWKALTPSVWK